MAGRGRFWFGQLNYVYVKEPLIVKKESSDLKQVWDNEAKLETKCGGKCEIRK